MKSYQKCTALLLCALLLSSLFVSCGTEPSSTETAVVEETEAVVEETKDYLDTLPVNDYQGEAIRFAAAESYYYDNFPDESATGEIINDTMIERNQWLEERFNVKFENNAYEDPTSCANHVSTAVLANEDAYDIVMADMAVTAKTLLLGKQLFDYENIPYVDLTQKWWSRNNSDVTIAGKHYYPTGPFTPQYFDGVYLTLFNHQLAEDYHLDDLLAVALEGKWTLDKLEECMANTAVDLNGDGVMNLDDQWSMVYDDVSGYAFYFGAGGKMTQYDSNDLPYIDLGSEEVVSLVQRLCSIVGLRETCLRGEHYAKHAEQPVFREGRALFAGQSILLVKLEYREMEDDFGMLPMPKYDENQPEYISYSQPWAATGAAIPITNTKLDATGLILETMTYVSDTLLRDAVYETTYKGKLSRDERISQVLDIIVDSARFDINVFLNWGGTAGTLREAVLGEADTYVSTHASQKEAADTAIAQFCELFLDSES